MTAKGFKLSPSLSDFWAPGVCPFCSDDIASGEFVCDECLGKFERVKSPMCPVCGNPFVEGSDDHLCLDCSSKKPPFDMARSAMIYKGVLANMLKQLKYRRSTWAARALASFMEPSKLAIGDGFDLVVPVPQTSGQLTERGHNQAVDLAVAFCELFGFKDKLSLDALVRIKWLGSQVGLSKAAREENVRGAFSADKELVRGKSALVIDDIITTGATCRACAGALKRAGAERVVALSFARRASSLDQEISRT